ncbi:MAG: hypothetical protein P4L67_01630 [Candidatus Pacebacteria bacterium]|nr:hypothetical protein [Candidatus Paceibacterota bacterium]
MTTSAKYPYQSTGGDDRTPKTFSTDLVDYELKCEARRQREVREKAFITSLFGPPPPQKND